MNKFESMCEVMKSDGGVAVAAITGISLVAGGYYFSKRGYKADVRKGENSVTIAPAQQDEPEQIEANNK